MKNQRAIRQAIMEVVQDHNAESNHGPTTWTRVFRISVDNISYWDDHVIRAWFLGFVRLRKDLRLKWWDDVMTVEGCGEEPPAGVFFDDFVAWAQQPKEAPPSTADRIRAAIIETAQHLNKTATPFIPVWRKEFTFSVDEMATWEEPQVRAWFKPFNHIRRDLWLSVWCAMFRVEGRGLEPPDGTLGELLAWAASPLDTSSAEPWEQVATTPREDAMIDTLRKLARLGNGDRLGNSEGNCLAVEALRACGVEP